MDSIKRCPTCGKEIVEKTLAGNFKRYCSPECSPSYGVARPLHSIAMKKLAAEGRLKGIMKKGKLHNKSVNSECFKRKCMEGSVWFSYRDDETLEENYSRYQSMKNTRVETKTKRARDFFPRMDDDLQKMYEAVYSKECIFSDSSFLDKAYRLFWGLRTCHYNRRSPKKSVTAFKAATIHNLTYNLSGARSVYVRSSYEAAYVKFFEEMHIPWEYEKVTLLSLNKEHHYTPDFYIEYEEEHYLIEVKGSMSFYSPEVAKEYIEDRIGAGVAFCKEKGWHFILTFLAKPTADMSFLQDEIL